MKRRVITIINGIVLIISILLLLFSAVSGAQPGVIGILYNLPNAIPWVIILFLSILNFRYPKVVGILFLLFGILSVIFFKTYQDVIVFIIVSLPWLIFGILNLFLRRD